MTWFVSSPSAGCRAQPRLWRGSPASRSAQSASTSLHRRRRSLGSRRWNRRSRRRLLCLREMCPQSPRRWKQCSLKTDRCQVYVFFFCMKVTKTQQGWCLTNSKSRVTVHGLNNFHSLQERQKVPNEVCVPFETQIAIKISTQHEGIMCDSALKGKLLFVFSPDSKQPSLGQFVRHPQGPAPRSDRPWSQSGSPQRSRGSYQSCRSLCPGRSRTHTHLRLHHLRHRRTELRFTSLQDSDSLTLREDFLYRDHKCRLHYISMQSDSLLSFLWKPMYFVIWNRLQQKCH